MDSYLNASVDPHISYILKKHAVRTFQWTQLLDDASGVDGEWRLILSSMSDSWVVEDDPRSLLLFFITGYGKRVMRVR